MFFIIPTSVKGWQRLLFVVCVVVSAGSLLLGGVSLFFGIIGAADTPYLMSEISNSQLEKGNLYKVDELYILDTYCIEDTDVNPTYYCLATFEDQNRDFSVVTLIVENTDAIYNDVVEYMLSPDTVWGDLVYSCYIYTESAPSDASVLAYYNISKKDLIEEGYFFEDEFKDITAEYRYDGSLSVDEVVKDQINNSFFVAFFLLPLAVVSGFVAFLLFKIIIRGGKTARDNTMNNAGYRDYLNNYQNQNQYQNQYYNQYKY